MGKYISGSLICKIEFHDVYVVDEQDELEIIDAVFPDGWEGEMMSNELKITEETEES